MTEPEPTYYTTAVYEELPPCSLNLARRAVQLSKDGNGRHRLELIVMDGRWMLIVNEGKPEDLGGG